MADAIDRIRRAVFAFAGGTGLARAMAPWLAGQGAILMLHSVTATPDRRLGLNDHLTVTPDFLDAVLAELRRAGQAVLALDEFIDAIGRPGTRRITAITLDDAYRDNLVEALPVFEAHETPFTIFVAPGLVDGSVQPWWDVAETLVVERDRVTLPDGSGALRATSLHEKRRAVRELLHVLGQETAETERQGVLDAMGARTARSSPIMSWEEIDRIARHRLATIGAHTVHHYALRRLDADAASVEMIASADALETRLGRRPRHFAYPYGHAAAVGEREAELARAAGFASAVTTRHGTIQPEHARHLHALPRISLNGRYQDVRQVRTMLTGFTTLANARRRVVTL